MYRQVFGKHSLWLRPWIMFHGTAVNLLDVEYRVRDVDGQERVVDRFEVLGYERRTAPKWVRRVIKITKLSREMCRALGPGTDLRIYAHKATVNGWKPRFNGEHNLCRPRKKPRR